MKKVMMLFLALVLIFGATIMAACPAQAADDQLVCGNSYLFSYEESLYLLKFTSSNPELPCSSGTVALYWPGDKKTYDFTVNSTKFITVKGLGKFILDDETLYLLDSTSIVFSLY